MASYKSLYNHQLSVNKEQLKVIRELELELEKYKLKIRNHIVTSDVNEKEIDFKGAIGKVCEHLCLSSKTRKRDYVHYRFYVAHLLSANTTMIVSDIGTFIGNFDHSTVLYWLKKHEIFTEQKDSYYTAIKNDVIRLLDGIYEKEFNK